MTITSALAWLIVSKESKVADVTLLSTIYSMGQNGELMQV
jgi:hypothetical protein